MIFALSTSSAAVTNEYISGSGIASGYGEGYYTEFCFENYCPLCGYSQSLAFNPKGTYEGEITCMVCDADYSLSGKDKSGEGARAWLIPYEIPEPKPVKTVKKPEPEPNIIKGHVLGEKFAVNVDVVKTSI